MENIEKQLNTIKKVEMPFGVHQSIMKRVNYRRFRPISLVSFILLFINFVLLAWHINTRIIDAELVDMMQDLFASFSMDMNFFNTIFSSFFEVVPFELFISAVISFVGIAYLVKKITTHEFSKSYKF